MLYQILHQTDKVKNFARVSAHCDVPCGIYDPSIAQIAALTVIRCTDQLNELIEKEEMTANDQANFSRIVATKEEHSAKVKEEIRIIWGDFIKQPQLDEYPELNALAHSIMMAASKAKQHIDKASSLDLLDKVNRFAEIFWALKGVETYRAICPYAPSVEVIYPDLKS